jgi:hypothetical protein
MALTPQLYPPPTLELSRKMFSIGSTVTVLKSGKIFAQGEVETMEEKVTATTEAKKEDDGSSNNKFKGRLRVRFLGDSSTAHIRPKMLVPHPKCERALYVAPTTDLYRRFAKTQGNPEDVFIEIGSDFGQTTAIIRDRSCPHVVGIDKSESHVEEARVRYSQCTFVAADVLKNPESLRECVDMFPKTTVGGDRECVCFIDINGNRPLEAVQQCLNIVEATLKPKVIVVKSKEMYKLGNDDKHYGGR